MKIKNKLYFEEAFVNGQWKKYRTTFKVLNPATGECIANVADLPPSEVDKVVEGAAKALGPWQSRQAQERSDLLMQWFKLINSHADDLAELITLECGKAIQESYGEISYGNAFIEWFAEENKRLYGETIPAPKAGNRILTIRQGVGVVAAITPWNFPLAMITRKVAPALAAGCSVILKPASETPLTALALASLAEKAGFPAGVFSVVTGTDSAGIGEILSTHPLIQKLSFTGSTKVGRILMAQAASTIKKTSMELGGNAPFLIFDDANLEQAVQGVIAAKFRNSGQTCVAANRILVQDKIYKDFAQLLTREIKKLVTGNGMDKQVNVGPLINSSGLHKVQEHIHDAVEKGASILTGGKLIKGLLFEPTVLSEVSTDTLIAKEETFGPVASLFRFKTEAEGIQMANDTEYGLVAYFYSQDIHRCIRVSEALQAGMVGVNTGMVSTAVAPFGGIKQSGLGREGSKYGLEEYTEIKYINIGGN